MEENLLNQIVSDSFPQTGLNLAFAYGSRIIKQKRGTDQSDDLIDFIFAVDNPHAWHEENLRRNRSHYSFLRHLPNNAAQITDIQENYGAKIYFNPYVRLNDRFRVKYGIIKMDHLIEDLRNWNNLYVAGRLHKPVEFILDSTDHNETLKAALCFNRESAIRSALLQLPETFTAPQLFQTVTSLSYLGDIRMFFGEDKNKVSNIVCAQIERFHQLYLPILKTHSDFRDVLIWSDVRGQFSQDCSASTNLKHLKALPSQVRKTICKIHESTARTMDCDAILASAARSINCDMVVAKALTTIVRRSSLSQSFKGLFTAGFIKSVRYSQRKMMKSLVSRLTPS